MPTPADLVTMDGGSILAATAFLRDCSFPVSDLQRACPPDGVIANFPIAVGAWEDETIFPAIESRTYNVDADGIVDECDTATVDVDITECEWLAPDMKEISLSTKPLLLTKLIPKFCKMRRISQSKLGILFNRDGTLNEGNEYAWQFARFAVAVLRRPLMRIISKGILVGDSANLFDVDGFYTQLENGWVDGAIACNANFNTAQTFDWGELTTAGPGPYTAKSPDAVTVASKTVTLWGAVKNVPAGLNLAQLLDWMYFEAVEVFTSAAGGITAYEIHAPLGAGKCLIQTASCVQPCEATTTSILDPDARERLSRLLNARMVEFYPSGRAMPILESEFVADNTLWIGPREIGGLPTYAAFLRNIDDVINEISAAGLSSYAQDLGLMETDPLLPEYRTTIQNQFEDLTMFWDVTKVSAKCLKVEVLAEYGVLVTNRDLWLKVTNVACDTWITECADDVVIDTTP